MNLDDEFHTDLSEEQQAMRIANRAMDIGAQQRDTALRHIALTKAMKLLSRSDGPYDVHDVLATASMFHAFLDGSEGR